ncbi:hypothetical protein J2Z37_005201 [Ammoniphilus resinae]|uniref:Enoyl-CoA hydratase n=1 Tax=Ammoniphilus resinae TaxID=861532 RepID=A0ABS4GXY7_9BACL|nr:hypothetical protein [Ammoniphilus resinae]
MMRYEKSEVSVVVRNSEPMKAGNSLEDKTWRNLFSVIEELSSP